MRTYDFSPLYRSFVGFDRMADLIDAAAKQTEMGTSYPPYNVAKLDEDSFRIELAVAGFSPEELEIESNENVLTVKGVKTPTASNDDEAESTVQYLHRGIAERGFERRFQLADHVVVTGADMRHGLLVIELRRELPEALKPRRIAIGDATKTIESPVEGKAKRKKAA